MITLELRARTPDLRGLADIRLMTLEDGPGRGQRLLIARNADGLSFEVAVDRGFDLAEVSFQGVNIGWHSPNQMRFPGADASAENGWSFFRSFDGFLVTCGLDHFGGPVDADISVLNHPHLKTVRRPLHGRISGERARLVGYGIDEDSGAVWCEGIIRQTSVFGEVLEIRRRIAAPIWGADLAINDTVTNKGYRPTAHAILYHFNFGFPFLDEATVLRGLPSEFLERFHAIERRPRNDFGEMVDVIASEQERPQNAVSLLNEGLGLEATLHYSGLQLPSIFVWRAYQSGIYALGIEPASHGGGQDDWPLFLAPGEKRTYNVTLALRRA